MAAVGVLRDPYGRPVDRLRVAVTCRCNYRCLFCHREGFRGKCSRELSVGELLRVVRVAVRYGIRRVKLTGGEPLLRRDIFEIVRGVASLDGVEEVSMVTNGYYLPGIAMRLREAGLSRVNVSLPSLDRETYRRITGVDELDRAVAGIRDAVEAGLRPVKINFVYLRGLNEGEVWNVIKFAEGIGADVVRVIEYHEPLPVSPRFTALHAGLAGLAAELEKISVDMRIRRLHSRPQYILPSGLIVELVKPMFNPRFCAACTKLRVTHDGYFRPCLLRNDNLVRIDFSDDESIARSLVEAVKRREPYFMEGREHGRRRNKNGRHNGQGKGV